jgi:glycosyltransferase involved in cell wall biosynthesis
MTPLPQTLPRITLVTPSLNAEQTIERTLRSIEDQAYPNLQMICVDGNSTDSTPDIIGRYGHIVSHVIREKDKCVAEAVNKGFRLADGEIYCYLNADDALTPGALNHVANIFLEKPGCRCAYRRLPAGIRRRIRVRNPSPRAFP